jgi:hypothetical protein
MVIRFPRLRLATFSSVRKRQDEVRLESHPSGLNRTDARRLSRREVEHRERMLRHLELVHRDR